jgi:hypothetical protein
MPEREKVVELPFAADSCPCVEKLRTVLPLTGGIRDGVVHLVSTLRSADISARAELGSIIASALPVATLLTRQPVCVCVWVLQREETRLRALRFGFGFRPQLLSSALLLQGFSRVGVRKAMAGLVSARRARVSSIDAVDAIDAAYLSPTPRPHTGRPEG